MTSPKKLSTHDIDAHVGRRVRDRRVILGMEQEDLAEVLRVTLHKLEGYENGTRPIDADLLPRIARVLAVPITYFYDTLGHDEETVIRDISFAQVFMNSPHFVEGPRSLN